MRRLPMCMVINRMWASQSCVKVLPIFTKNGEVIALLHEGNIIGQITKYGKVDRAPSAAQVNFGVRVDLIEGMGELKPISELVK